MHILLLLSGIADPKWTVVADPGAAAALPRKLSPFDESALECALKLRDADPATSIGACVFAPQVEDGLLRAVASHRPDRVTGQVIDTSMLWDARAFSGLLADIVRRETGPDLVLMGREFGDGDDGALAACLAETLQWPFVGLAQAVTRIGNQWELLRERGDLEEHLRFAGPLVASVTNDRNNRLRHPLMKNVALARKQDFEVAAASPASGTTRLLALQERSMIRIGAPCRMITGSVETQAAELAALMKSMLKGVA